MLVSDKYTVGIAHTIHNNVWRSFLICFGYRGHFLKGRKEDNHLLVMNLIPVTVVTKIATYLVFLLLASSLYFWDTSFRPQLPGEIWCVVVFWYNLIKPGDSPSSSTFDVSQSPQDSNIGGEIFWIRTAWSVIVRHLLQSWTYSYVYFEGELLIGNVLLASLKLLMSWLEFCK